MTVLGQNDS